MMFLFQILSRPVYVVPACMLRGTFLWVLFTLKHTVIHRSFFELKYYSQIPFKNNHFENAKRLLRYKALSKAPNRL